LRRFAVGRKRIKEGLVTESVNLSGNAKAIITGQLHVDHYHEAESHRDLALHAPFASIPSEPPAFLRRDELVNQIVSRLLAADSDVSLYAVWGRGGVGKTCIAQAVSFDERVRERFPDGIIWQRVGRNPSSFEERVSDIVEKLNVHNSFTKFDAGAYRSLVSRKQVQSA
jgi:NB-ARC domain-containing protein